MVIKKRSERERWKGNVATRGRKWVEEKTSAGLAGGVKPNCGGKIQELLLVVENALAPMCIWMQLGRPQTRDTRDTYFTRDSLELPNSLVGGGMPAPMLVRR
jgi:hypothetical protein